MKNFFRLLFLTGVLFGTHVFQNAMAYQCEVACQATFRMDLGWYSGSGANCGVAKAEADNKCEDAAGAYSYFSEQGGCTADSSHAVYSQLCWRYTSADTWSTVFGQGPADTQLNAKEFCDSFCEDHGINRDSYNHDGFCRRSSSACTP